MPPTNEQDKERAAVLALDVKTDSAHYNKAQQLKGGLTGEELRADLVAFFGNYTDEMAAAQKVCCALWLLSFSVTDACPWLPLWLLFCTHKRAPLLHA